MGVFLVGTRSRTRFEIFKESLIHIFMRVFVCLGLGLLFLVGCATKGPYSEFVRTTTFSSLQTFDYRHSFIAGMDFRESEQMMLEELSREVMLAAFSEKGFQRVSEEPDFYVVVRWRKSLTTQPDIFDSIDGPRQSLERMDRPGLGFAARVHLTVEVYEREGDALFWRKELPNVFEATQFTEDRIVASLQRAVVNFPNRVERDPELMDIE